MESRKWLKVFTFLVLVFGLFFFFDVKVNAKPIIQSVTIMNNKDVVKIKTISNENTIIGYYIGNTADISKAMFVATNATELNLSMMSGKQYIWAKDNVGNLSEPYEIILSNSCIEENVPKNATDSGTFKKCGVYANGSYSLVKDETVDGLCANGYSLEYLNTANVCNTLTSNDLNQYDVGYRYCQITFSYKCSKNSGNGELQGNEKITSYLNNLGISSGTLSPAFKDTTYNYSASVNVSAITISASLNGDGSSFVDGYGPKTYNLQYGLNTIYIKVKSRTNNITTYTLKITRIDNRNNDNTLGSLSTNIGTLSPEFNSSTTSYTVKVNNDVSSIAVNAKLNNTKSTFVSGYEPRVVNLKDGENEILIKVKSESGATKSYKINVIREVISKPPVDNPVDKNKISLLSSIELSAGNIDFKEDKFEYTVYVEYKVNQVLATAKAKDALDKVTVKGGENLEVGKENPITIDVYNTKNNFTRTYTINVIRKEENLTVSSNSKLSSLSIEGHSLKFDKDKTKYYKVILNKNEVELKITAVPEDDRSTINIVGNSSLKKGSEVVIEVTAEDSSKTEYVIKIDGVSKGVNIPLIIILLILIVVVIGYIILRLMGYKVYFNFSLVSSFFKSIGEKIKNIFDR